MPATVTNLAEWKAAHPPIWKLWDAHCRFVSAWSVALFKLAIAPIAPQIRQQHRQDID